MESSLAEEHGIHTLTGRRARAEFFASTAFIGAFAMLLIWAVQRYLVTLNVMASVSPDAAIQRAGLSLKILALVMGGLAIGTSWYTVRSCNQVLKHRQLPPPGAWVLGRPTVLSGTRAVVWGHVGQVLGGLLAVLGVMFTYLLWQFVDLMMSGIGPA